eukprot:727706-Pleurochrysis_carterae.AAC.1
MPPSRIRTGCSLRENDGYSPRDEISFSTKRMASEQCRVLTAIAGESGFLVLRVVLHHSAGPSRIKGTKIIIR